MRTRLCVGHSLFVSAALAGFLGWRLLAIAPRLPALTNVSGVREGLTWPLELRVRHALARAPMTGTAAAESAAVLALLQSHVPEHAVVLAELERGRAGAELGVLLASLAFPRVVLSTRIAFELDSGGWRALPRRRGLFALVRAEASPPCWPPGMTRVAATALHELWRLEEPSP